MVVRTETFFNKVRLVLARALRDKDVYEVSLATAETVVRAEPDNLDAVLLQGYLDAARNLSLDPCDSCLVGTLRRSDDAASSKSAIHMVSAWATMNHISLGQVLVDAKSKETTAIPNLLDLIDVSGGMVTIDAMGCQTEITENIGGKKRMRAS